MSQEIASAYILLEPKFTGLKGKIEGQLGAVPVESAGKKIGSRLSGAIATATKAGLAGVGLALGKTLFDSVQSGISQQDTQKTLTGLYGDPKKAKKTFQDIAKLAALSPLTLESYGGMGENLAYLGIEGKKATGIMENVGKAVVSAGKGDQGMQQASDAFTKMVNAGGPNLESILQLSESGVPILSALAAEMGVSIKEVRKMASEGEITMDDVMGSISNASGKSFKKALSAYETSVGSFSNRMKIGYQNIADALGKQLVPILDKLGPVITKISASVTRFIQKIPSMIEAVTPVFKTLWDLRGVFATLAAGFVIYKATLIGMTVAAKAWAVVSKVVKFATAGWAVQQRLLNIAMRANPIGIIITVLTLLVAGVVLAYKKIGWFRKFVDWAFAGIQKAIKAVVKWFKGPFVDAMKFAWNWVKTNWKKILIFLTGPIGWAVAAIVKHWDKIKATFRKGWNWVKQYVVNPVINFFTKKIPAAFKAFHAGAKAQWNNVKKVVRVTWNWIKNNIVQPVIDFFTKKIPNAFRKMSAVNQSVWQKIKEVVRGIWNWIKKNIVRPIIDYFRVTIPNAFRKLGSVASDVWQKIKDVIRNPYNWIRKNVFNPLVKFVKTTIPNAFEKAKNTIGKAWGALKGIAKKPVKFLINTVYNDGIRKLWNPIAGMIGKDDWKLPKLSTKGWKSGGYTGNGPRYKIAGAVHADEYVVNKPSRRKFERSNPGTLDYINRHGSLPGYAVGGRVSPLRRMPVTQGYHGGHNGIDYGVPIGTPVYATGPGRVSHAGPGYRAPGVWGGNEIHVNGGGFERWFAHLSSIAVRVGQRVSAGQMIGRSGNSGISSGPHLHFGVRSGGRFIDPNGYLSGAAKPSGGGGGIGGFLDGFKDLAGSLGEKFAEKFPGGARLAKGVFGMGKKAISGIIGWIPNQIGKFIDKGVEAVKSGTKVTAWATEGLMRTGNLGPFNLASLIRRILQESSGNPRAVNNWDINAQNGQATKGLMQLTPANWRTFRDHALPNDIFDPVANIVAAIRYTRDRYGNLREGWDRVGGYATGTKSALPGFSWVGERGPELVDFRGGERVINTRRSRNMARAASEYGGDKYYLEFNNVPMDNANEVADSVIYAMKRTSRGGVRHEKV